MYIIKPTIFVVKFNFSYLSLNSMYKEILLSFIDIYKFGGEDEQNTIGVQNSYYVSENVSMLKSLE